MRQVDERRTTLEWNEYPGDEITVRLSPVPLGRYLEFMERWQAPSTIAGFREEVDSFVELAAPTWTFPAERFLDLDLAIVKATINEWLAKVPEVPLPLPAGSSATEPSEERLTPSAAAASTSPSSSRTPRRSTPSSDATPVTR